MGQVGPAIGAVPADHGSISYRARDGTFADGVSCLTLARLAACRRERLPDHRNLTRHSVPFLARHGVPHARDAPTEARPPATLIA